MEFNKVSVIGLGYIGLPTAAVLASRGIDVVGVDVTPEAVATINRGEVHIVEPDLDIIVRAVVTTNKLRATLEPEPADAFMIAVPTPFKQGHEPDLSFIRQAAEEIAPVLARGNLVVLESTSPVGATEQLSAWLAELRPDLGFPMGKSDHPDVHIAHCPERVLPGQVLHELVANDRVIGGITPVCAERAEALYKTFVRGECVLTDARTAELCKLTENAYRDVNIAFANELSIISDRLRINVWELIPLANRHPRVNILNPGPGVGGHCIAVDPWFIVSSAPEQARLIRTAREVNDSKPSYVIDRVRQAADEFKRPVIACLGLAFKADIDDLRESPAVAIVRALGEARLGRLLVVEPHIRELPPTLSDLGIELVGMEEALDAANTLVTLVDHKVFKGIPVSRITSKVVIDTRGLW
ncbi:UDP-N-acetyl-D-mannosamine dehydrogenase [Motiliproteus sp. SC1-56]|uniref:UDP-N-acetyl-D-mannosamine dehydrogenase n=1 Tax=Motiliproteus sp. SC1-56 TaxID=2799565 RepID=UPI001A903CCA|nr:UDP-N-acetyl-D-mannosamine dehydrogenase [Motiliproteus sp. SC1-56]